MRWKVTMNVFAEKLSKTGTLYRCDPFRPTQQPFQRKRFLNIEKLEFQKSHSSIILI